MTAAQAAQREKPSAQPVAEGTRIADQRLRVFRDGQWHQVDSKEFFGGRRVVVFGLPGAFTPVCSSQHLPRYNELAPKLFERGIDEIVCVSVNDPHVLGAWAREQQCDCVALIADGNGEFSRSLGMLRDRSEVGYGLRSWRYSMLVEDGRIAKLFVEPQEGDDPYGVSSADTMLKHLDPAAQPPEQVVLFTRDGCPHCEHAKELLDEAGLNYIEFPLDDNVRSIVVGALTGNKTVPQVFISGELIGGEEELQQWLERASDGDATRAR